MLLLAKILIILYNLKKINIPGMFSPVTNLYLLPGITLNTFGIIWKIDCNNVKYRQYISVS